MRLASTHESDRQSIVEARGATEQALQLLEQHGEPRSRLQVVRGRDGGEIIVPSERGVFDHIATSMIEMEARTSEPQATPRGFEL
jgi:hypothetical protein